MRDYRVKVDEYRGFEIWFDKDDEFFYPESAQYDGELKKAKSYAAAKKWVDDYVKENMEFAPFLATSDNGSLIRVIGIRKDKRFMYVDANKPGDKPKQLEAYNEDKYFLNDSTNEPIFDRLAEIKSELTALYSEENVLKRKLVKTTLDKIKGKYSV